MKIRTLLLMMLLLFAISFSFAEDNFSINPLVGSWVNTDYYKIQKDGKWIIKSDFTLDAFDDPTRTTVPRTFTIVIDDSWSDAEGNLFYKLTFKRAAWEHITYELWRLDSSQTVLESMWGSTVEHPEEIKVGHSSYSIHYRQE